MNNHNSIPRCRLLLSLLVACAVFWALLIRSICADTYQLTTDNAAGISWYYEGLTETQALDFQRTVRLVESVLSQRPDIPQVYVTVETAALAPQILAETHTSTYTWSGSCLIVTTYYADGTSEETCEETPLFYPLGTRLVFNSLHTPGMSRERFSGIVFHETGHFLGWSRTQWLYQELYGIGIPLLSSDGHEYIGPAVATFQAEYGEIPFVVDDHGHLGWRFDAEGNWLGEDEIDVDNHHVMDAAFSSGEQLHINWTFWAILADQGWVVDWSAVEVGLLEDVLPRAARRLRGDIIIVTD